MSEWKTATLVEMLDRAIVMLRGQNEQHISLEPRKEYLRLPTEQVNDTVRIEIEERSCIEGHFAEEFDQACMTNGGTPFAFIRLFDNVPFVVFAVSNLYPYRWEQNHVNEDVCSWADEHEYKLLLAGDLSYEDIVFDVRGKTLYKVLRPDGIATKSGARWPLPGFMKGQWIPGAEVIVDDVNLCLSGLHFSNDLYDIYTRWYPVYGLANPHEGNSTWPVVYEAEALCEVGIGDRKGKVAVPMARLLKRADNISDRFTKSLESFFFIAMKKVTRDYPYGVYYRQCVLDGNIVEVTEGREQPIFQFSSDTMQGNFPYGHLLVHFAKMAYREGQAVADGDNLYPAIFVYLLNGMLHWYEKDKELGRELILGAELKQELEFLRDTLHYHCNPDMAEWVLDSIAAGSKPLYVEDGKLYVLVEKAVDSDQ